MNEYYKYQILGLSTVVLPSNLLFMVMFGWSEYENKLWNLKSILNRDYDNTVAITEELKNLQKQYSVTSSRQFETITDKIIENKESKYKKHTINLLKNEVDCEIIRVQPIRYILNEVDNIPAYKIFGLSCLFIGGIFIHDLNKNTNNFYQKKILTISRKMKYPFVLCNLFNFSYMLGRGVK